MCCLPARTVLCPAPTPSRLARGGPIPYWRWCRCLHPYRGGSLQFRVRLSLHSTSLTPEGSSRLLPVYGTQFYTASMAFALRIQARLPLGRRVAFRVERVAPVSLTTRQTSLDAADCRFACLPFEDFVSGLHRPDFAGFVASVPLSYSAAGSLPRPDFHRQASRGLSGHTIAGLHMRFPGGGVLLCTR